MINTDEDALICDLAETYHIYDYRSLPIQTVAAFSVGLRTNSRIKVKLSGLPVEPDIFLLASIVDRLSVLVWRQTKDGEKGINAPKMLISELMGDDGEDIVSFVSGEEFERERARILRGE